MADWSSLPYDIIHKVSTYLIAIEDFLAFSAVCCSWRSVYLAKQWHPGPQFPLLMFCDYENSSSRSFFSSYRNKICNSELPEAHSRRCWGSSLGWLITIGSDLKIHLLSPFTHIFVSLPPKSSLQIHFGEILRWYDIIEKAFVFRKPCTTNANEEDLVVMIIYGPLNQLAFCMPGYSSWKRIKAETCGGFMDVACVRDRIIALSEMGFLLVVDIDTQTVINISFQPPPNRVASSLPQWDWDQLFLVESSGNLWIVFQDRSSNRIESVKFRVHSYDFNQHRWIRLSDLGTHTIFVGDSYSASISGADCLNCKSNSIYFIDKKLDQRWPYREVLVDVGVYSMATGISERLSFSPCSFPLWVTPTLE